MHGQFSTISSWQISAYFEYHKYIFNIFIVITRLVFFVCQSEIFEW